MSCAQYKHRHQAACLACNGCRCCEPPETCELRLSHFRYGMKHKKQKLSYCVESWQYLRKPSTDPPYDPMELRCNRTTVLCGYCNEPKYNPVTNLQYPLEAVNPNLPNQRLTRQQKVATILCVLGLVKNVLHGILVNTMTALTTTVPTPIW
jgi:hypothetical protein